MGRTQRRGYTQKRDYTKTGRRFVPRPNRTAVRDADDADGIGSIRTDVWRAARLTVSPHGFAENEPATFWDIAVRVPHNLWDEGPMGGSRPSFELVCAKQRQRRGVLERFTGHRR